MDYISRDGKAPVKEDFSDIFVSPTNLLYSHLDKLKEELFIARKEGNEEKIKELEKKAQELSNKKGLYTWEKIEEDTFNVFVEKVLPVLTLERYVVKEEDEEEIYDVVKVLGKPIGALKVEALETDKNGNFTGNYLYNKRILDEDDAQEIMEKGQKTKVFLLNALCVGYDEKGKTVAFHFPQRIPIRIGRYLARELVKDREYLALLRILNFQHFKSSEKYIEAMLKNAEKIKDTELKHSIANAMAYFYNLGEGKEQLFSLVDIIKELSDKEKFSLKQAIKEMLLGDSFNSERGRKKAERILSKLEDGKEILKEFEEKINNLRKGKDPGEIAREVRDKVYKKMLEKQAEKLAEMLDLNNLCIKITKEEGKKKYLRIRQSVDDYLNPLIEFSDIYRKKITFSRLFDLKDGKLITIFKPFAIEGKELPSYMKHARLMNRVRGLIRYAVKTPRQVAEAKIEEFKNDIPKLFSSRIDPVIEELMKITKIELKDKEREEKARDIVGIAIEIMENSDKYISQARQKAKENITEKPEKDRPYIIALARARVVEEVEDLKALIEQILEKEKEELKSSVEKTEVKEEVKEEKEQKEAMKVEEKHEEVESKLEEVIVDEKEQEQALIDDEEVLELLEEEVKAVEEVKKREIRGMKK